MVMLCWYVWKFFIVILFVFSVIVCTWQFVSECVLVCSPCLTLQLCGYFNITIVLLSFNILFLTYFRSTDKSCPIILNLTEFSGWHSVHIQNLPKTGSKDNDIITKDFQRLPKIALAHKNIIMIQSQHLGYSSRLKIKIGWYYINESKKCRNCYI